MPTFQLEIDVSPSIPDIAWWTVTILTNPPVVLDKDSMNGPNQGFYTWTNEVTQSGTLTIQFHISPLANTALADCYVTMNKVLQKHPLVCTADKMADQFDYPVPQPATTPTPNVVQVAKSSGGGAA